MSKIRKTSEINAGKQASLSLFSKAAKNNFLLLKVMEFIKCISYTTSIFHQVQMLETEAEVAREQKEIHGKISFEIIALEKQFHQILTAIKTETNDTNIPTLKQNAKEVLSNIHQSKKIIYRIILISINLEYLDRYKQCVHHLDSFVEKAKVVYGVYRERVRLP